MGQVIELIVNALLGWVPERPRWAMGLVVSLYVAVLAAAAIATIEALA